MHDSDATFSGPQTCSLAGITYRKLDYWCRIGVLRPAFPARGSGSQRRFDFRGVQVAWALGQLSGLCAALPTDVACLYELERWSGWLIVTASGATHVADAPTWEAAAIVVDLERCPLLAISDIEPEDREEVPA